jgi:putative membrane protein
MFLLICVAVAGLYGAATVGRKILFIQTVPAVLAIIALWLGW